jgi:hypothetical protein
MSMLHPEVAPAEPYELTNCGRVSGAQFGFDPKDTCRENKLRM